MAGFGCSPRHESTSERFDEKGIAALAYLFWHERGCPIGSDQEDWFRAEETLKDGAEDQATCTRFP